MTTAGPNLPDTAVSDSGMGSVAWTNPGNATADDSSNATCAPGTGNQSEYLWVTGFGFSAIGDTDTIDAIQVDIIRSASTSNRIEDASVRLIIGGSVSGDDKQTDTKWSSTETTATYGDQVSDVWGLASPVGSDVNDADFGVALSIDGASTAEGQVDYIQVTIVYTAGAVSRRIFITHT